MAKNIQQKAKATPADKLMITIIVVVILAVLGLAIFATYGKISANIEAKQIAEETEAISKGEMAPNVRYLATSVGMSEEEYLAQYGLELGKDLNETSTTEDMIPMMTVENYYKFVDTGAETPTDVDKLLSDWGAADLGITKDTVWSEAETKIPFVKFVGEESYNELLKQYANYGYDLSSITKEMTLKEANDALEKILSEEPAFTPVPTAEAE